MSSAFHRSSAGQPKSESVSHHRVTWRLHPALTSVLNRLERTALGQAFKDRAVEVSASKVLSAPIDHSTALVAYRWVLERADGDGLPLTASGYLKPADVQALAELLPTMRDWPFKMAREIDVDPVLDFREHLKEVGLLRKYKASLRLTKAGREGLADADALWLRLADALVFTGSDFDTDSAVVILVHMATTDGPIDVETVAKTMVALGWSRSDGTPAGSSEVYPVWNDLWAALGNVGDPVIGRYSDRNLSAAARVLVHDALFTEVEGDSTP